MGSAAITRSTNGNKQTALASMLVHLGLTLAGVNQTELYDLMIAIANHQLVSEKDRRRRGEGADRPSPDEEVQFIYPWLRDRAERIEHGERVLSYRQLRQALAQFGIETEVVNRNRAELVRFEERGTRVPSASGGISVYGTGPNRPSPGPGW